MRYVSYPISNAYFNSLSSKRLMFVWIPYLNRRYFPMWMPYLFHLGAKLPRSLVDIVWFKGKLGLLRLVSPALTEMGFDQAEAI